MADKLATSKPNARKGRVKPIDAVARQREARAIEMKAGGASLKEIGEALNCSVSRACHIVTRGLARSVNEPAAELRQQEGERMSALIDLLWVRVVDGDLLATDRLLKAMDRYAKLLGLDMPTRSEVEVTTYDGDSELDRRIAELMETMAGMGEATTSVAPNGQTESANS